MSKTFYKIIVVALAIFSVYSLGLVYSYGRLNDRLQSEIDKCIGLKKRTIRTNHEA